MSYGMDATVVCKKCSRIFSKMYIMDNRCPSCNAFFGLSDMIKLQNDEDEQRIAKKIADRYTKKRILEERRRDYGEEDDDD